MSEESGRHGDRWSGGKQAAWLLRMARVELVLRIRSGDEIL